MLYVGLDLHSKHISICVLDERGNRVLRTEVGTVDGLAKVLGRLEDRFEVCFEASCGYGWYFDLLRPLAAKVVVAHPGQLRLIFRSKHKNDRQDAERLAKLLFLGEVPTVHVPESNVRAWRELITCRRHMVEKRTKAKNGVRSLLRGIGQVAPRRPGLWTRRGRAWLMSIAVTSSTALRRDLLLDEIDHLSTQIGRVERELDQIAASNVAVEQLMSIPGVGVRTAEAMVAFLDNPHRFRRSKQVGRYFGLVPSQDQSGNTNRLGHITREGSSTVRRLLTEASWQSIRRSPTVRAYFERIRRDDPARKKIAIVATAHYLARVMYGLLKRGELWMESAISA